MTNTKLILDRVPRRFNEGMFWGNGCMGALLYVKGNEICFAVDHMMLWETRDSGEDRPGGTFQDFMANPELFHNGTYFYSERKTVNYYRTRLPGLSLSFVLQDEITDFYGELDYRTAVSEITFTLRDGSKAACRIYMDSNVNLLKVETSGSETAVHAAGWDTARGNLSVLKDWGYPAYEKKQEGEITHVLQPYSEKGVAVLSAAANEKGAYVTLQALLETEETAAAADRLTEENRALLTRYQAEEESFLKAHKESWEAYWSRSDLQVPNERLQQAYDAEMYKIYSNEREKVLPVTLQGVWNNDSRMPAWCGDLHNDMNVEACYWPVYKNNHAELGSAYIDYYAGIMPRLMERAEKLFGIKDAIHCPVMMAPGGYGAGGEWCFWNCLLGPELFVATDFIWYYAFSGDGKRLASAIYPFLERVIHLYQGIAYRKEDGFLHIPFCNSPEVFKDGRMLIGDDSTVVISTLHYVLAHLKEYAEILGKDGGDFEEFDRNLVPVTTGEKGYPLFPGEELFESHRHFCQLFPVFPLGVDIHSDCADRSLNAVIDKGYTEYASWSFPYLSIFASRCGRGNMAAMLLELYCQVFRSRNTFCANGDPNQCGVLRVADTNAGEPSDTFTLEAGFILAAAMSEMFVHRSGNEVYVAYGIPDEWKSASCRRMVIEGGHRISVEYEEYRVKKVTVEAGMTEKLRFHFAKDHGDICVDGVNLGAAENCEVLLEAGNVYQITAGTR
ncbi:MAG: hypothetical protein HDR26_00255 [Lachnospiraceae bacterium]|nr:hypothetical protein [Lachnospiraceae bacterium]